MSEKKPYPITAAVVRQRTDAATRHGGRSESQISASARAHKRRLMRQMNLRIRDLDGISLALVDGWARAHAVVTILTEHYTQNGLFRPDDEVDPSLRTFFTGINSSRLQLQRLAEHLEKVGHRGETLQDYIDAEYGGNGDSDADE
jgi:hypothetical protein